MFKKTPEFSSTIFHNDPDGIARYIAHLGHPTIVFLPHETTPASVWCHRIPPQRGTISISNSVFQIDGERVALVSQSEINQRHGDKIASNVPLYHEMPSHLMSVVLREGLFFAKGRYCVRTVEKHDNPYEPGGHTIKIHKHNGIFFEGNDGFKEYAPTFNSKTTVKQSQESDFEMIQQLLRGHHCTLETYRETLRRQVMVLFNLAGLLVHIPPDNFTQLSI